MNPNDADFDKQKRVHLARLGADQDLKALSRRWFNETCRHRYSYHFTWLGRPIIQYPQDIVALQEIIWSVKPDLIVETGVAHGGSVIFSASMLALLGGDGHVVGVDIDIREHNRRAIESHPLSNRITLIQGSSIAPDVASQVHSQARSRERILLILDSNHTHEHVLKELELYSGLVKAGSYIVVFDTVVEDMPSDFFPDRPWGPGNNPRTAVREFLKGTDRFVVDEEMENKLLITVAPGGYLRCTKD